MEFKDHLIFKSEDPNKETIGGHRYIQYKKNESENGKFHAFGLFNFHDSTFECIARSFELKIVKLSMLNAIDSLLDKLFVCHCKEK